MGMKWTWRTSVPPEVKVLAEPILLKWEHLVPVWCTEISVYWIEDDGASASIKVRESQRDAELFIHPNWVTFPDSREDALIHELCHFYNAPLKIEATDSMRAIIGNDYPTPGSKVFEDRLADCIERQNNDLVALISRLAEPEKVAS